MGFSEEEALVRLGADGKLIYATDQIGNRIPDFSWAGYAGGGVSLPDVRVVKVLEPSQSGDDTAHIQAAIDALPAFDVDNQGFRGVLLLKRGVYRIAGTLNMKVSGVVLRGQGQTPDGTILLATGTKQRTLISAGGRSKVNEIKGSRRKIADNYVPWGISSFALESIDGLSVGDSVIVYRPSTSEWIRDIKMDQIVEREGTRQWKVGGYDLRMERTITSINGNRITLNAPVINALDKKYGGGFIYRYTRTEALSQIGIEGLRLVSEYNRDKKDDEEHAWTGIAIQHAANVWVRNITTVHFSHGVSLQDGARFVTVQDCACLEPISIITGGRRYPFSMTNAQYCLVQRCYSHDSRHAAATGSRTCGPNVFLDCFAENTHADTGPHHRWAAGILWDNLKGGEFNAQDRGNWGTGHGWAGAQQVFWNCETSSICVQQPPTAQNYAIGCTGKTSKGRFEDRQPGCYESHGRHVEPRSLYLQQLEDRMGKDAVENITTDAQRCGPIYNNLKAELSR
jgi:hypothetical protein